MFSMGVYILRGNIKHSMANEYMKYEDLVIVVLSWASCLNLPLEGSLQISMADFSPGYSSSPSNTLVLKNL